MNTAYSLHFGPNVKKFATDDSWLVKRAPWLKHHLWVTPFKSDEMHSSGNYPNQSDGIVGGPTIEAFTEKNRNIQNQNLVLWITTGVSHIVKPEDFPIMPVVVLNAFSLTPFGFFDQNPVLDVPDSKSSKNDCCQKSKL